MSREDALLSLERHATSKLASDEDLLPPSDSAGRRSPPSPRCRASPWRPGRRGASRGPRCTSRGGGSGR
jgi:hypothetical protein